MPTKGSSFWVFAFGYVIFAVGIIGMGLDFYSRSAWSYPLNMGIVVGNSALCLLGLTAQVVARSIQSLEKRLDSVEKMKSPAL